MKTRNQNVSCFTKASQVLLANLSPSLSFSLWLVIQSETRKNSIYNIHIYKYIMYTHSLRHTDTYSQEKKRKKKSTATEISVLTFHNHTGAQFIELQLWQLCDLWPLHLHDWLNGSSPLVTLHRLLSLPWYFKQAELFFLLPSCSWWYKILDGHTPSVFVQLCGKREQQVFFCFFHSSSTHWSF